MRRLLRNMRYLAAELSRTGSRPMANRLLSMAEMIPGIRQPWPIREFRSELLTWRLTRKMQDDLSVILSQLRAHEHGLED